MFDYSELLDPRAVSNDVKIHPSAIVARGAKLGKGVVIGPRAVIGPNVELHDNVKIGVNAVVEGWTTVGRETAIYAFATIGAPPQDLKYAGEDTKLVIGEKNNIREYVNISIGTKGGGGITRIGNHNLIMAYSHIAHDCQVASDCIFANGVQLAGHVVVQDRVVFGGMSGGHQFCHFGEYAMVGAGSIVVQDVMPYCMVQGDRAAVSGLNVVGLRRAGLRGERMEDIKKMYRILFKENLTVQAAAARIKAEVTESQQKTRFLEFLSGSERGVCR